MWVSNFSCHLIYYPQHVLNIPVSIVQTSVLAVDDAPDLLQLLKVVLHDEPYDLRCAENGEEAMRLTREGRPDLLLLDIDMPGMDGFEVCRLYKKRKDTRDIPVIFLTSQSETDYRRAGLAMGAIDYITKPFDLEELKFRIRNHLEVKQRVDRLEERTVTDSLTGLYNQSFIHKRMLEEISYSRRHNEALSIAMLDLDHFKQINDTFGHMVGDEVLERVAAVMRQQLRSEDIACRYGGEEFLVILPATPHGKAIMVLNKLRQAISEISWRQTDLRVTASAGVSTYREGSPQALIADADKRLYQAKALGRNQVVGEQ